jgi:hypothetical protein
MKNEFPRCMFPLWIGPLRSAKLSAFRLRAEQLLA